jgi:hypothetical protein
LAPRGALLRNYTGRGKNQKPAQTKRDGFHLDPPDLKTLLIMNAITATSPSAKPEKISAS